MATYKLLVMGVNKTHNLSEDKEGNRWLIGDLIDIYKLHSSEMDDNGNLIPQADGCDKFIRIYITDCNVSYEKIRNWVCEEHRDVNQKAISTRRRKIPINDLPLSVKRDIQKNRYYVATFDQVRNFIKKRLENTRDEFEDDVQEIR